MAAVLEFRLTGGSSNSDEKLSLGGVMSSTSLSGTALNNLFDDVKVSEANTGVVGEYRFLDVYNSGDVDATSVKLYIDPNTSSTDTSLEVGHDATNDPHAAAASLETLGSDTTAPASPVITFAEHGVGAELTLPDIPTLQACRICFQRIVQQNAVNTSSDTATLNVTYA